MCSAIKNEPRNPGATWGELRRAAPPRTTAGSYYQDKVARLGGLRDCILLYVYLSGPCRGSELHITYVLTPYNLCNFFLHINFPKIRKSFKNQKIFQKSENLPKICLIKCLKGHKSLGSLCSVVKTLIVSGARPTDNESYWAVVDS